jgi:hypothetical protein
MEYDGAPPARPKRQPDKSPKPLYLERNPAPLLGFSIEIKGEIRACRKCGAAERTIPRRVRIGRRQWPRRNHVLENRRRADFTISIQSIKYR